jgi:hypothetical protein
MLVELSFFNLTEPQALMNSKNCSAPDFIKTISVKFLSYLASSKNIAL